MRLTIVNGVVVLYKGVGTDYKSICGGPTYEIVADERTKGSDNASE